MPGLFLRASVVVTLRPAGMMAMSTVGRGGGTGWQRIGIGGLGYADFESQDRIVLQ